MEVSALRAGIGKCFVSKILYFQKIFLGSKGIGQEPAKIEG